MVYCYIPRFLLKKLIFVEKIWMLLVVMLILRYNTIININYL